MVDFFDITTMNSLRIWTAFAFIFLANIFLFRGRYHSFLDPLFYILFWMSSIFSVSIELALKFQSSWAAIFLIECILLNICLYFFSSKLKVVQVSLKLNHDKKAILFFVCMFVLIFIIDGFARWSYLLNNGLIASAMYKFGAHEKNQTFLLSYLIILPVFIYLANFYILLGTQKQKILAIFFVSHNVLIQTLTSERGALLNFLISFGFSAFYFRKYLSISYRRNINLYATVLVLCSLFLAAFVSSMIVESYVSSSSGSGSSGMTTGIAIIENRLFANADCLYYFLTNDGASLLDPLGFVIYNFGVFINAITAGGMKSFGWLLMDRVYGTNLEVVQGANYIVHLQALNYFSPMLFPFFLIASVWITLKLRYLSTAYILSLKDYLFYSISALSLTLLTDSEFPLLRLIILIFSVAVFYVSIILPLRLMRFLSATSNLSHVDLVK